MSRILGSQERDIIITDITFIITRIGFCEKPGPEPRTPYRPLYPAEVGSPNRDIVNQRIRTDLKTACPASSGSREPTDSLPFQQLSYLVYSWATLLVHVNQQGLYIVWLMLSYSSGSLAAPALLKSGLDATTQNKPHRPCITLSLCP